MIGDRYSETVANDSSTTHFLVGVSAVSVTVKSGVMSTQPSAGEFAGLKNKSKKSTAIGVFIFVFAAPPDRSKRRISLNTCSGTSCCGSIAGEVGVPIALLACQRLPQYFRFFPRVEMADPHAIISLSLDLGLNQIAIVTLGL